MCHCVLQCVALSEEQSRVNRLNVQMPVFAFLAGMHLIRAERGVLIVSGKGCIRQG